MHSNSALFSFPLVFDFDENNREMTVNYASLLALNPDMFPNTKPENPSLEGIELSAFRLVHLFSQNGYSPMFMQELNAQLKQMDEDVFQQLYTCVFLDIRSKFG